MTFAVDWEVEAQENLREIDYKNAAIVERAVNRLATDGTGDVRPGMVRGSKVLLLRISGYRVALTFDRAARVLHVWTVWAV